ncbi:MAG: alpha/beta hydrolase [Pseudomonadota bacterium]
MVAVFQNLKAANQADVALDYRVQGGGEPLVLLHSLGGSAGDWSEHMTALASRYRVIAPSLRGFGDSQKPDGPMTIMQYADDVIGVLDELNIVRAHVLGHSMGGAVALQLAVAYPERLNSLIVINSQASFQLRDWRRYLVVLMRFLAGGSPDMARLSRFLARRVFPEDHQRDLRAKMQDRFSRNDHRAWRAAIDALAGWSVEDLVDKVATPTLVVAGEHDVTPVEQARAFADRLPQGELHVVPNSGHATPFDQQDTVIKLVFGFLATSSWGRQTSRTDRRRTARS